jgi:hypothetical protein
MIGVFIRDNNPSNQRIQALICDLLPDDEILIPIRDCISRPSFSVIKDLAASGHGAAQLDALLHELSACYVPEVIANVQSLLKGILALPTTTTVKSDEKKVATVWVGALSMTITRAIDPFIRRFSVGVLMGLLTTSVAIATYFYLANTAQQKTMVVQTAKSPVRHRLETNKGEQGILDEQIPKGGKLGDMPLKTMEKPSRDRGNQPISTEEEAISLVKQMVPSVRQAFLNGSRMRFIQENQYDDCNVLLRSYLDMPTHIATLGWYKVDLCNKSVADITTRPEDF